MDGASKDIQQDLSNDDDGHQERMKLFIRILELEFLIPFYSAIRSSSHPTMIGLENIRKGRESSVHSKGSEQKIHFIQDHLMIIN